MSHFSVAVFHKPDQDIASLLAPYSETDKEYFVAEPLDDEDFAETKAAYLQHRNSYYSYDDFMEHYYGFAFMNGTWNRWHNPNAKWDWYSDGGRFSGELTTLEGEPTDEAVVKDIDWSPDPKAYIGAIRFWEVAIEKKPLHKGEKKEWYETFYKPEYYTERYRNAEEYAIESASSSPYAFVSSDGKWYGRGNMGWFGCDDATAESISAYQDSFADYIANHPDEVVTMVDCHI